MEETKYTKEELIEILIQVDREDMNYCNDEGTIFSDELHKKIANIILPTLIKKHKELG